MSKHRDSQPFTRMPRVTINVSTRRVMGSDGYAYASTPKFFFFYLLLCWYRVTATEDGWVTVDAIWRLPHWERDRIESVGKQVRRHLAALERAGRNVVEHQQKVKGPFRLRPAINAELDGDPSAARNLLDSSLLLSVRRASGQSLFRYVEAICSGNVHFDAGRLKDALADYTGAASLTTHDASRAEALLKRGRTLERLGNYRESASTYHAVLALHSKSTLIRARDRAKAHVFIGWLNFRRGRLTEARRSYERVLDLIRTTPDDWLMGNFHNGLGWLDAVNGDLANSVSHFEAALDHWSRSDYPYGVAAAYANIGIAYKRWGNQLRDIGDKPGARLHYTTAIQWLQRCLDFSAAVHLGADTSEAERVVAAAHLELRDTPSALKWARQAQQSARSSGNARDLASATRILARIYAACGERLEALRHAKEALRLFRGLEGARIAEITAGLERLISENG